MASSAARTPRARLQPCRAAPLHGVVAALAGAAIALAGCRESLPEPIALRPMTVPPPATEYLVRETQLANGAVSVKLHIPFGSPGPKPTLIFLIGSPRPPLSAGFVIVTYSINWKMLKSPEAEPLPSAEERVGKWVLTSPSAGLLGERYLREITATANEHVPQIIDWLALQPEVDAARIGMAGGSTNGFVTLQVAATDRRLAAGVAIAACGDYRGFLRDSSMGMQGQPLALDARYARWMRSQELIRHPGRVTDAAVLMMNRTGDQLIPVACADKTARVLQRVYAKAGVPERFRYVRFDREGHGIGADEYAEALAWFQRWLQPQ